MADRYLNLQSQMSHTCFLSPYRMRTNFCPFTGNQSLVQKFVLASSLGMSIASQAHVISGFDLIISCRGVDDAHSLDCNAAWAYMDFKCPCYAACMLTCLQIPMAVTYCCSNASISHANCLQKTGLCLSRNYQICTCSPARTECSMPLQDTVQNVQSTDFLRTARMGAFGKPIQ